MCRRKSEDSVRSNALSLFLRRLKLIERIHIGNLPSRRPAIQRSLKMYGAITCGASVAVGFCSHLRWSLRASLPGAGECAIRLNHQANEGQNTDELYRKDFDSP